VNRTEVHQQNSSAFVAQEGEFSVFRPVPEIVFSLIFGLIFQDGWTRRTIAKAQAKLCMDL